MLHICYVYQENQLFYINFCVFVCDRYNYVTFETQVEIKIR